MHWVLLASLGSLSITLAFLVDGSHDETLQMALQAIEQLNSKIEQQDTKIEQQSSKLNDVIAENKDLKSRLASYAEVVSSLENRVSSDLIWMDNDWALVFRATSGIGQQVYDAWTKTGHHDDDPLTRTTLPCGCTTVNGSLPCDRHYRSRLLDVWPSAYIDEVKLVVYEMGVEKQHVTFSGTGSSYLNWFSKSRLLESSWTDLKGAHSVNYFSIAGDASVPRRFDINQFYHGCDGDIGWLTISDSASPPCSWESAASHPAILYSPSTHAITWHSAPGPRHADVMAVFVKFRSDVQLGEICLK